MRRDLWARVGFKALYDGDLLRTGALAGSLAIEAPAKHEWKAEAPSRASAAMTAKRAKALSESEGGRML